MDPSEEKALKDIEKHGCHILNVLESEDSPNFSYSIGITKTVSRPELIVTGLKFELANSIINEYLRRIENGEEFKEGEFYSGFIQGFDVTFRAVLKKYYCELFGWAIWYYGSEDFKVLQLVYPSVYGRWPWNKDAPEEYTRHIPELHRD